MPELDPTTCALCRRSEDPKPNRIGGLNLCRRCYDGGAVAAARERGFQLGVECSHVGRGEERTYFVQGSGGVGKPLFNARFKRKGLAALGVLLGWTMRVDDPLFHKLGVILSYDKARTRRFIDGDGPQSAVMDLLGEDVGIKVREQGSVSVFGSRRHEPYDPTTIERELAVLLVHLDAYEPT